jgi:hypothetical protein
MAEETGIMSEDEMIKNFDQTTATIMQIFDDPIFQRDDVCAKMQEIDF